MPVIVLGLSHKTAPPQVRDRHSFPPGRIAAALSALHDYPAIKEAAIVSTCNRLEIYADVADYETGVGGVKDFLTTFRSMGVEDFDKYLYTLLGADAVVQLFRVAGGLDSMLIGEAEILAQVKEAMQAAQQAGTLGPHLSRLFRSALRAGKRARTETAIGRDAVSLGAAAVDLAARCLDLPKSSALVIGAGRMGATVARHLAARGAGAIAIANRTRSKAEGIAAEVGGTTGDFQRLPALLEPVDLVISAVGSGAFLLDAAAVRSAMRRREGRPLVIIDIAVPRDVDPEAAAVAGTTVYELADLRAVVDDNLGGRQMAVPAVESIVQSMAREYMQWYQSRAAVPLIAGLRKRAEAIRLAELEKLFARYPMLSPDERDAIGQASVAIINKLLHDPMTKLRETVAETAESSEAAEILGKLFDLAEMGHQIERQFSATLKPPAS